mgnify:CR=1 FL=1
MLALDPKLAKKIGEHHIIAYEGKNPVFAITSNYLKCRPCIMPDRPDKLLRREDWMTVYWVLFISATSQDHNPHPAQQCQALFHCCSRIDSGLRGGRA